MFHHHAHAREKPLRINATFDAGNIEVVDASNPHDIRLKIRPDPYCKGDETQHFQWFSFRASDVKDRSCHFKIVNAGQSSFPVAWPNYQVCASYDAIDMFRIPTHWDEKAGVLSWKAKPEHDAIFFFYWVPYSYTRHQDLVARLQVDPKVCLEVLGQSLDGRDIDLLVIGTPAPGKKAVWVVARQHPGESMAEWFMEGFLEELADPHNPFATRALRHAVFYAVPNMNPDGAVRGHLRTNAAGANLNREWQHPTLEHSPEVFHVKQRMEQADCDFFLDIAYNFLAGIEGIPAFDEHLSQLSQAFTKAFERATPDFQAKPGYEIDPPGQANLAIASNYVGQAFKCLSFTLEMPFKARLLPAGNTASFRDTEDSPDPVSGWSAKRAKRFGASALGAIYEILPQLGDVPKPSKQEKK